MVDIAPRLARIAPSEQSFFGYLFWVSRPRFWLYLAGPVIVGVVYAANSPAEFFTPIAVLLFAYFLLPANGINDIFDADIDRFNPKKSDAGREVRYTKNRTVVAAVCLAALLAVGFVPFLPMSGSVALAGFLLLGAAYSAPPARLKTVPLLDSVSNGLYILPGVVAYAAISGELPPTLAVAAGWLWAMGMHTFSAIPDIQPDRRAGIRTTATVLGTPRTLGYCAGCWGVAAALMGAVHPAFVPVFVGYPVFIGAIVAFNIDISRAYWWFPVINTVAGTAVTMMGVWVVLYG